MATSAARAKQVFQDHGGTLRTHEALTAGIHPRTIYVAVEGLRLYRSRKGFKPQRVLEFARVCRVEKVIRPHLEVNQ